MNGRNNDMNKPERPDDKTGKSHGSQGIDKAPGEETSGDMENVVRDTQKGKNKVDGDPSRSSDHPIDSTKQ